MPFKPVSIRVSQDPVGLISKVLEQNPGAYSKLDDLIGIGQNLMSAGLERSHDDEDITVETSTHEAEIQRQRKDAERRVTFMAVEAALREDDFETAYSYIINRLTPSTTTLNQFPAPVKHVRNVSTSSTAVAADDDISWRAAFLAGRFRPTTSTPPTLRRLEQRTELLSLALLLAPVSALTDILSAWRRCEEEATAVQLSQREAEQAFDDRADKRQSLLPGQYADVPTSQPDLLLGQKRREMGRLGAAGEGEAPVSMFDLTRSAAVAAFGRGGGGSAVRNESEVRGSGEVARETEQERVRKRDMVANAVSGGLASGLGWVLGATPAER